MIWNARGARTKAADWDLWVTFPRNAYRQIDLDAAATKAERAGLEERRDALAEIRVHYRRPDARSVTSSSSTMCTGASSVGQPTSGGTSASPAIGTCTASRWAATFRRLS